MNVERRLGFEPVDREVERLGYDIESRDPSTGHLRFIEVKGRVTDADTVTVTKNEILYSLNMPEHFIRALVEFLLDDACASRISNALAASRIEAPLRGAWRLAHDTEGRSHASLKGHTPLTFADGHMVARVELNNVRSVSHCRDLVQLPVAA